MNIRNSFLIILLLLTRGLFACDVKDDIGQIVHLPLPAQRIISLAPDLTEIIFTIGAGDRVVGVMQGSDYPSTAANLPVVANYNNINMESILALHPDLIIVWSEVPFLSQLKQLNIPVFYSHQKMIMDIPSTMRRLGCLVGNDKQANESANLFIKHYQQIQKNYTHKKPIRVFYQVWSKPLMKVSKESWINEIITACGGKNIFSSLKGSAPQVSLESVMVANPVVVMGSDVTNWSHKMPGQYIFFFNTDLIERAGPRILDGVDAVCKKLDEVRNASSKK